MSGCVRLGSRRSARARGARTLDAASCMQECDALTCMQCTYGLIRHAASGSAATALEVLATRLLCAIQSWEMLGVQPPYFALLRLVFNRHASLTKCKSRYV
eukprot:6211227-Pleurochrysis_carterae.AAC.1